MARPIRFRVLDGIAIVSLDAPPVNALTAAMRETLWQIITRCCDDPALTAIVLRAEGQMFSAGSDIGEFSAPQRGTKTPTLGALCDRIEACPKPVIAALHGKALGGGAELALAAHYRLAEPGALVAFPEVSLGLLACAGGTQRLPRLVGAKQALHLMVNARGVSAQEAQAIGLVDGLVEGDLASGAVAFAREAVVQGLGVRPTRARRAPGHSARDDQAAVAAARRDLSDNPLFAPHLIVDAIEAAALLPFDAGRALEEDAFDRCLAHPQSHALRHVWRAERRIDPRLIARDGAAFRPTDPEGRALVLRLHGAYQAAALAMVELELCDAAALDRAVVAHGFREGPFGGREAGPGSDDLIRRVVAALLVEGAALLAEGLAARPSDIDALAVHGLGYPRHQGGPMRAAQSMGLTGLRRDMRLWAEQRPLWAPPPLLDEALKDAKGFDRFD